MQAHNARGSRVAPLLLKKPRATWPVEHTVEGYERGFAPNGRAVLCNAIPETAGDEATVRAGTKSLLVARTKAMKQRMDTR